MSKSVVVLPALGLHKRKVFLENDPYVGFWLKTICDYLVHIDQLAILVAHAFCEARVSSRTVEVDVAMECHV